MRQNPAGCLSRGLAAVDLGKIELWWHGPAFLIEGSAAWPEQPSVYSQEMRSAAFVSVSTASVKENVHFEWCLCTDQFSL